ncbi:small acid-soluble spore protein SspI [Caldalkalibacillus salinus]|uniref:small acid-soluble spore protein SspI n=1 Tax=Caldalkalibacillus salinus TaxID=2803787 RepID=UPI001922BF9D|nr:small acid-soluble spore protein SspI [Caldalkalibacillus salinus]
MNLNLRHAITDNLNDSNEEHIRATILDAIESGEEKMLPGLGVLFELMWNECGEQEKADIVDHIKSGLQ